MKDDSKDQAKVKPLIRWEMAIGMLFVCIAIFGILAIAIPSMLAPEPVEVEVEGQVTAIYIETTSARSSYIVTLDDTVNITFRTLPEGLQINSSVWASYRVDNGEVEDYRIINSMSNVVGNYQAEKSDYELLNSPVFVGFAGFGVGLVASQFIIPYRRYRR